MSRRCRRHRKRFVCGHRGFGQYCHRCAEQKKRKETRQKLRQAKRQQWLDTFEQDEIELRHLPKRIVKKVRTVLAALSQGTPYWQLSGKRFGIRRDVIKILVTRRYRLICRDEGSQIKPLKVISHEDYNPLFRTSKRLLHSLFTKVKAPF